MIRPGTTLYKTISLGLLLFSAYAAKDLNAQDTPAEQSLFEQTLAQDIATADLQELIIWARSLGLSVRGTREEVENRILEFYEVARSAPEDEPEPISVLSIERARGTDYFTVEEVDEQYLRIYGGVVLRFDEEGASHRIESEEVTINLATDTLSARGRVEYSVERSDGVENFRGREVVFQIESWEGLFVQGVTESREDATEDDEDFAVAGERITRSAGEIIVIDRGTMTSSPADPPNYQITAARIWVLAPGEWALRNAVLYVGRVPMLYFPAFFLPGDRLFFTPSVGSRDREGAFVQTTTYLIGQSEDQEPPLSLMRLGDDPEDRDRVIDGLFLRIPDEPPPPDPEGWSLKIMADTYTKLGGYSGVAATLPDFGPFTSFDWRLGLGASRNIYFENGTFSSFYVEDGESRQHWNSGAFFGTVVPFRYETELETSLQLSSVSLSLEFLLLSDPEFRRDFWNRDEGMDWSFLFSSGNEDDEDTAPGASTVTSMEWVASLSWSPELPGLRPWINDLSITNLETDLQWRTRDNANLPDPVDRPESDESPEEEFFFPQSVLLPELNMRMSGTLYEFPPSLEPVTDAEAESENDPFARSDEIRPPWDDQSRPEIPEEAPTYRLPDPIADLSGVPARDPGGVSLSYTLTPTLRYDRFTNDDQWDEIEDVELIWAYSTFQTRNTLDLTLEASTREGFAKLTSSLDIEQRYQEVDDGDDISDEDREQLREDAFRFTGEDADQDTSLTIFPLLAVSPLAASFTRYRLSSLVFEREFVEIAPDDTPRYDFQTGSWNDEDISVHETEAQLAWSVFGDSQTLTGTAALPPLDGAYTGALSLVTGPLTSTLSGGYREDDDGEWTPDNLVQNHALSLVENNVRASQRFEYDLEETRLQQASSSITLWPLSTTLTGRYTEGFRFVEGTGWVEQDTEDFRWTTLTVGLDGERELNFWKRRIDVSLNSSLGVDIDLLRYSSSSLVIDYGFTLDIYRFLDLEFSASSRNDFIYQYFEGPATELGRPRRRFGEDLINSFRLFDQEAREESFFKIDRIDITAIHDLQDWELSFTYSGSPQLEEEGGVSEYRWRSVFAILLRWRSISELQRNIRIEDGEVEFIEE